MRITEWGFVKSEGQIFHPWGQLEVTNPYQSGQFTPGIAKIGYLCCKCPGDEFGSQILDKSPPLPDLG